ncbi:cytochrome c biogenesis CcdA family protein [Siminovitchia sp. 179-K 8D1 HS]|uniref:cytochrome c biogenesis CcdA family protein n=1 Tax=Siminovitchia sp. 179-K 8D1 HS TaxID=3142385 RepID=UPI00399F3176
MLPAILGFLSGEVAGSATDHKGIRKKLLLNAVYFILGFTFTMVILGIIASWIGEAVASVLDIVKVLAGVVLIVLGLLQMKILQLNISNKANVEIAATKSIKPGFLRSFVTGMVIAPGWGNIFLGSVLLFITVNGSLIGNILHMLAYSLGFGIMFLIAFLFAEPLRLLFSRMGNHFNRIQQFGGTLIVIVGLLMVTNKLGMITGLATWSGGQMIRQFLGME